MLDNLQPNIIKAHVREFLTLIFLRFDDKEAAKSFLRAISTTLMKSAKQHLMEIEAFKAKLSTPGTPYIGLGLTDAGYQALQIAQRPSDPIFRAGMQKSVLNDPDVSRWDSYFRHPIHAVVLVGDMLNDTKVTAHDQVVN
jgi:hypothetical protein